MKLKDIKKEIIDEIHADIDPKSNFIVDELIKIIEGIIEENNLNIDVFVGGSYAKKTFLSKDFDVDTFLRVKNPKDELDIQKRVEFLIQSLKEKIVSDIKTVHGSRDYYQLNYKGIDFELVPNKFLNSFEDYVNTTDISPLQVKFLKEKQLENESLNDEIRLVKRFMKTINCYGAESYLNGLSGHTIDVLSAFFSSFEDLINFFSNIDLKNYYFIDVSNFYSDISYDKKTFVVEKHELLRLKQKFKGKINSHLVVVDPIDKNRIASAALFDYRLRKITKFAKWFKENPDKIFFQIKSLDFEKKDNRRIFRFKLDNENKDICGSKALHFLRKLSVFLKENDFEVVNPFNKKLKSSSLKDFHKEVSEQEEIVFKNDLFSLKIDVKKEILSDQKKYLGPFTDNKTGCSSFKKAHEKVDLVDFAGKKRLIAYEKREIIHLDQAIDLFLSIANQKDYMKHIVLDSIE